MFFGLFQNKKSVSEKNREALFDELVKYLILQIPSPSKATSVITEARNFVGQPTDYQNREITPVYLLFEKYCCDVNPLNNFVREEFKDKISTVHPWVKSHDTLGLVFKNPDDAVLMLSAYYLKLVIDPVIELAGNKDGTLLSEQAELLNNIVNGKFSVNYRDGILSLKTEHINFQQIKDISFYLFNDLSKRFGTSNIENLYNKAFEKVRNTYQDFNLFPFVIELIPAQLLRQEHLRIIGIRQIKQMLNQQIDNLEKLNRQLKKEADENKELNNILAERSANLERIFNNTLDAIIIADTNNKITYWNKKAEQIFGYNRNEVLNKPLTEFIIPPELQTRHDKGIGQYLNIQQKLNIERQLEVEGQRKNGQQFPVEIRLTGYSERGKQYFISFIRDITKEKEQQETLLKARDQAEGSNENKSRFLTTISHEIRTPVNAIMGFSELMSDTNLDDTQQEYLQFIRNSGVIALELINNLIELNKLESGKLTLNKRPGIFREELDKIVSPYKYLSKQKNLDFNLFIEDALPYKLELDYFRLRQVLTNLINNSLKFTDQGKIRLGINYDLDDLGNLTLVFIVSDTGKGISEDKIEEIFTPHLQEDHTIAEKYGGSGLGLSICREIVEMMGGKISAVSPSKVFKDKGSDFRFTIKTTLS